MNDFTKEELKEIRNCIFYAFNNAYNTPEELLQKIYHQIVEMIDTYCEHKETDEKSVLANECTKCEKVLDYAL